MCQICLKGSLPVDMVSKTDKKSPTNVSTPVSLNSKRLINQEGDPLSPESEKGCGLCIECDNDCLTCDVCPNLFEIKFLNHMSKKKIFL